MAHARIRRPGLGRAVGLVATVAAALVSTIPGCTGASENQPTRESISVPREEAAGSGPSGKIKGAAPGKSAPVKPGN